MGSSFFVYILLCSDQTLYVGHATDVPQRLARHNAARGATWTAHRLPVTLAYQEEHPTEQLAIARELQLKRWTNAKKLALIAGNHKKLKSLAKRRIR